MKEMMHSGAHGDIWAALDKKTAKITMVGGESVAALAGTVQVRRYNYSSFRFLAGQIWLCLSTSVFQSVLSTFW